MNIYVLLSIILLTIIAVVMVVMGGGIIESLKPKKPRIVHVYVLGEKTYTETGKRLVRFTVFATDHPKDVRIRAHRIDNIIFSKFKIIEPSNKRLLDDCKIHAREVLSHQIEKAMKYSGYKRYYDACTSYIEDRVKNITNDIFLAIKKCWYPTDKKNKEEYIRNIDFVVIA